MTTEPVGTARMDADGAIHLCLRAQTGGALGDAQLSYPPDHPEYARLLEHLGGLRPGEEKAVPPWG